MHDLHFRMATVADAPALAAIYAPYVATPVTFEIEAPDAAEFARRIRATLQRYPYVVCEAGGVITGYAYAFEQMERAAYRWNAGLSVYLAQGCTGRGTGTALYGVLLELLRLQHIRNVYGGITRPNPASEALHRKLGFTELGVYHRTGFKLGAWHDVVWYERSLADAANPLQPPLPFVPITDLPAAALAAALGGAGRNRADAATHVRSPTHA